MVRIRVFSKNGGNPKSSVHVEIYFSFGHASHREGKTNNIGEALIDINPTDNVKILLGGTKVHEGRLNTEMSFFI
jgi:hypothetical protein